MSKRHGCNTPVIRIKVTSKNALRGIFRDGNEKCDFPFPFIFYHLSDRKWQHVPMLHGHL